jgi:CheY-like chemotaxis protein
MQGHGGAAALESRPGGGTTVHLYFPAANETAARALVPGADPAAPRARKERLLFVDDDEALVFLANEMLVRLGYRVAAFDDPVKALAAFREAPDDFDGVISDVSMPRMSGFDLAARILSLRPKLPVVITSGYVRPEDEEAAKELGVRAVILKPNTVDEMAGELDRIFREAG